MKRKEFLIGIPLYSKENLGLITFALTNLHRCIRNYPDTEILFAVNGPNSKDFATSLMERNGNVRIIRSLTGVAQATKSICYWARDRGYDRILFTDVDIYRFPHSIERLYEESIRKSDNLIYANYSAYPLEVLEAGGIKLSDEEKILWRIFQADKHPLIRPFVEEKRKKRFKSSLVIGNPEIFLRGLNSQNITTDSVIAGKIDSYCQVKNAAFMHHGRVDLTDYIQARFRHIRAAIEEGRFNTSYYRQEVIYTPKEAQQIAEQILSLYPNNEEYKEAVKFFLLQAALRHLVYEVGRELFLFKNKNFLERFPIQDFSINSIANKEVLTYQEAYEIIKSIVGKVAYQIDPFSKTTRGMGITQEEWRFPIDVEIAIQERPYLSQIVHGWLGLDINEEI